MFARRENFRSFMKYYPINTVIASLHILLWIVLTLPLPVSDLFIEKMSGVNLWIAQGEYWRLLTPIIVHADFPHMLFNTFSLILFGPSMEKMLGKNRFLLAYLGTGMAGNTATFLIEPLQYSHVGSSGSIFGLLGIYLYLVLFKKERMERSDSQTIIAVLAVFLAMTFINPNTNAVAHIGGLLAGSLLAPLLLLRKDWN